MSTFSDFAFYENVYRGKLSEDEYGASVRRAYAEILSQTNSAAISAPESMTEAVKLCECELVDVIDSYKKSAALLPGGIGSVSNDGYSVSSKSSTGAEIASMEARDRHEACARYLQQPVNLMCRWL